MGRLKSLLALSLLLTRPGMFLDPCLGACFRPSLYSYSVRCWISYHAHHPNIRACYSSALSNVTETPHPYQSKASLLHRGQATYIKALLATFIFILFTNWNCLWRNGVEIQTFLQYNDICARVNYPVNTNYSLLRRHQGIMPVPPLRRNPGLPQTSSSLGQAVRKKWSITTFCMFYCYSEIHHMMLLWPCPLFPNISQSSLKYLYLPDI